MSELGKATTASERSVDWLVEQLRQARALEVRAGRPPDGPEPMRRLSCTVTAAQYEWVMRAGGSRRVRS